MVNPNKYVRKAVIELLASATQLPVFENSIPLDLPLNTQYIIVNSQSKNIVERSKTCWDWQANFNIDIHSINEKGFSHSVTVDDIEESVMTAMASLQVERFHVKGGKEPFDSNSDVIELPDATDNRTVLIYQLWLSQGLPQ